MVIGVTGVTGSVNYKNVISYTDNNNLSIGTYLIFGGKLQLVSICLIILNYKTSLI